MTFGARFGCLAVLSVILLGAVPALAQSDTTPGASDKPVQAEGGGGWTDPPVRGAAAPKPAETQTPSDSKAAARETEPAAPKPVERASRPDNEAPAATVSRPTAEKARPVNRSAKVRRERIRVAARAPAPAPIAQTQRPRYGRVARLHEHAAPRHATRRVYAYRARQSEPPRYAGRFAMPEERSYDQDAALPRYGARNAGWGGLIDDSPERRIARARAAGYIVVRARTYGYPDGTRVREMTPLSPFGYE